MIIIFNFFAKLRILLSYLYDDPGLVIKTSYDEIIFFNLLLFIP